MNRASLSVLVALLVGLALPSCSCGTPTPGVDAGPDVPDASVEFDAGLPDAGPAVVDAGQPDAGPPPVLKVTRLLPPRGVSAGGTVMVMEGSGFIHDFATSGTAAKKLTTLKFGGNPVLDYTIIDDETLELRTPPGVAGATSVVIQNPLGKVTCNNCFTYYDDLVVTGLAPRQGPLAGGTVVTLDGHGFTPDTLVLVGGRSSPRLTVTSGDKLTFVVPRGAAADLADVTTFDKNGTSTLRRAFRYLPDAALTAVTPPSGALAGGATVVLTVQSLYRQKPFQTLIFAIPNLTSSRRKEIIESLNLLPIKFKTIPNLRELLSNQASVSEIRNIDVSELLGREEITPNHILLRVNITHKTVLVTGAGGSIGSELCRQISQLQPKCLVLFELNEFALYDIDLELREKNCDVPIYPYLGNITDELYFQKILKKHNVETIYHAAAYKHVPLVEMNPCVGVYNNVAGTLTTARSAIACGVKNFVFISTDKAVRPTNVMGASKRVAELVIQGLAAQKRTKTIFAIVRFGNVLNSSGSVIPRFRKQISEGKPITLTHKNVTRYFISIPEAVSLVIQAGAMAKGGEIFLLDMGNPVLIYDLAVKMIELSGMEAGKDIKIDIIGLRPGEKLYEELLIDKNNSNPSQHPQIFSGNEPMLEWEILQPNLESLLDLAKEGNSEEVLKQLKILVPEFNNPLLV